MIKLIVCDVDGTILKHGQNSIPPELLYAFDVVKENNITLCFASGRSAYGLRSILGKYAQGTPLICCDGGAVVIDEKTVYLRPLSASDVLKITRADAYSDCAVVAWTAENTYILRKEALVKQNAYGVHTDEFSFVSGIYDIKEPIIKIGVLGKDTTPSPLAFAGNSMRVAYNANGWCEYVSAIANKGLAVSDLQMRLYLSKYDTACFGDGQNDVEMMKKAKLPVSVNENHPSLDSICVCHTDNLAQTLCTVAKQNSK